MVQRLSLSASMPFTDYRKLSSEVSAAMDLCCSDISTCRLCRVEVEGGTDLISSGIHHIWVGERECQVGGGDERRTLQLLRRAHLEAKPNLTPPQIPNLHLMHRTCPLRHSLVKIIVDLS